MDLTLQRHPVWRTIIIAVLGFIALAAWGLSSPAGSSPDDDFHLTSIWCAQGERTGLCENITEKSVDVPDNVVHAPCFAFNKDVTGACQMNLSSELVSVGRANALEHSYPGGFYWTMSWFAGSNLTLSSTLMRLFNAALFVAMATATYLLIERRWRAPLALGVAVSIVPLGMFIIPSTNPSSWTLYAPAFVFLLTRSLLHTNKRRRTITLAATAVAIAAIASVARSDAAVFAVFAVALAAIADWRAWFRRLAFYLMSGAIGFIAIWSLLAGHQTGAASGGLSGDTSAARSSLALLARNLIDLPGLLLGSLGTWNLGWLDTPMPSSVWAGTLFVLSSLVMTVICFKARRRELVISLVAVSALVVVPLAVSQTSGAQIGAFVQPRYVLPLLALALVTSLTTETGRVMTSARQLNISLVVLVAANLIALTTNTVRYSIGLKSANFSAGTLSAGQLTLLIATILVGGLATAALSRVFGQVAPATLTGDAVGEPMMPPIAK